MGKNYVFGNPPSAVAPALICVVALVYGGQRFQIGLGTFRSRAIVIFGHASRGWCFFATRLSQINWPWPLLIAPLAVGLGLINPTAYYLILFAAYDRLPAHIAQPINYTWAITLALLAVPILGQRLTLRSLWGILTSYLGVVILVQQRPGRLDQSVPKAWLWPYSSTVLWPVIGY